MCYRSRTPPSRARRAIAGSAWRSPDACHQPAGSALSPRLRTDDDAWPPRSQWLAEGQGASGHHGRPARDLSSAAEARLNLVGAREPGQDLTLSDAACGSAGEARKNTERGMPVVGGPILGRSARACRASGCSVDLAHRGDPGTGAPRSGWRSPGWSKDRAHGALRVDPSAGGVPEVGAASATVPPGKLLPGAAPSLRVIALDPVISNQASDRGVAGLIDGVGQ